MSGHLVKGMSPNHLKLIIWIFFYWQCSSAILGQLTNNIYRDMVSVVYSHNNVRIVTRYSYRGVHEKSKNGANLARRRKK